MTVKSCNLEESVESSDTEWSLVFMVSVRFCSGRGETGTMEELGPEPRTFLLEFTRVIELELRKSRCTAKGTLSWEWPHFKQQHLDLLLLGQQHSNAMLC